MRTIQINSSKASYPVYIGDGAIDRLRPLLQDHGKAPVFIITSPKIWALWQRQFRRATGCPAPALMVPPGEQHKNLRTIEELAGQLARREATRDALLIAFGGGVIGDIAGFLAATYMRGVDYVQVPTTLLAQVDASVGGKTGVNLTAGKNLIGSFNPPRAVFADTQFLHTLPVRELRAGLYESIKAGVLGDKKLFADLERFQAELLARDTHVLSEITAASVRVKAAIVMQDEHEHGVRMTLNFGHTLGHAIEAATRYRELLHGEAVAWGMRFATAIAEARGVISQKDAARIDNLILAYGPLPRLSASERRILRLTSSDKKNVTNQRRFILPTAIGTTIVATDVTNTEMLTAMRKLRPR